MKNTHAQNKAIQRERTRKEGYVLKQIWVKPANWECIKEYIGVKNGSNQD